MIEILSLSQAELERVIVAGGFPKFRAKQIIDYIYQRHITDFEEMLQLPKTMRDWLASECTLTLPTVLKEQVSPRGDTRKLLLQLADGSEIESVLMQQHYGLSLCVSSQVGCAMGCAFCASTREGLFRNLKPEEVVVQALLFERLVGEKIHSVVVMGAGEPMQNYDSIVKALQLLHEPNYFNIGYRRMTVSTCGIPKEMKALAEEGMPITLALSLHAPNDSIRQQIMPISKQYMLEEVLDAAAYYVDKTGRRLTFEYILIDGLNSSEKDARELAALLRNFPTCNINLIPVNGNEHINMRKPSPQDCQKFVQILEQRGYTVSIRKEMGDAIQAACGQLKVAYKKNEASEHKE